MPADRKPFPHCIHAMPVEGRGTKRKAVTDVEKATRRKKGQLAGFLKLPQEIGLEVNSSALLMNVGARTN